MLEKNKEKVKRKIQRLQSGQNFIGCRPHSERLHTKYNRKIQKQENRKIQEEEDNELF